MKDAINALWNARSQLMRLWSKRGVLGLDSYNITSDEPVWKHLELRYKNRIAQAKKVLIKNCGVTQTNALLAAKDKEWKKSGAWRKDVWKKPDLEIEQLKEELVRLKEAPIKDCSSFDSQFFVLQRALNKLNCKINELEVA